MGLNFETDVKQNWRIHNVVSHYFRSRFTQKLLDIFRRFRKILFKFPRFGELLS